MAVQYSAGSFGEKASLPVSYEYSFPPAVALNTYHVHPHSVRLSAHPIVLRTRMYCTCICTVLLQHVTPRSKTISPPTPPPFTYGLLQNHISPQALRHRTPQPLLLQPPTRKQPLGIPIRAIAQDRHHRMAPAQPFRHLLRRHHIQTRARAQVEPLFIQQPINHLDALRVADV